MKALSIRLLIPLVAVFVGAAVSSEATYYWGVADHQRDLIHDDAGRETTRTCETVRNLEPPPADLPTAADARALAHCSAYQLYYGIGRPKDLVAARKCAWLEARRHPGPSDGGLFGPGVLVNIYANGAGAHRELDLATKMACSIEFAAVAETEGRVASLQAMKSKPSFFDYCQDITSGVGGGECAYVKAGVAETKRETRLRQITAGWRPGQRQALGAMQKAEKAFADAHVAEIDAGGTIHFANQVHAAEEVAAFSGKLMDSLARGRPLSAPTAKSADVRLNAAYRKALAQDFTDSTVKPEDVRNAERAWIAYRDAWIALARVAWPKVPSERVAAVLSAERARLLADVPFQNVEETGR